MAPLLEAVDSIQELRAAAEDPVGFLQRLAKSSGPAAKKLAIMQLKPLHEQQERY